jgi:hypothetical protein
MLMGKASSTDKSLVFKIIRPPIQFGALGSSERHRKEIWKRPSNLCAKGEGLMQALYFAAQLVSQPPSISNVLGLSDRENTRRQRSVRQQCDTVARRENVEGETVEFPARGRDR